jgi:hypothetical protein
MIFTADKADQVQIAHGRGVPVPNSEDNAVACAFNWSGENVACDMVPDDNTGRTVLDTGFVLARFIMNAVTTKTSNTPKTTR